MHWAKGLQRHIPAHKFNFDRFCVYAMHAMATTIVCQHTNTYPLISNNERITMPESCVIITIEVFRSRASWTICYYWYFILFCMHAFILFGRRSHCNRTETPNTNEIGLVMHVQTYNVCCTSLNEWHVSDELARLLHLQDGSKDLENLRWPLN